jgi:hypothetical protein
MLACVTAALGIGVVAARKAPSPPDCIRARQFQVVDTYGQTTLEIGTENDAGLIRIYRVNPKTQALAVLSGSEADGYPTVGTLKLFDDHGNRLVLLGGEPDVHGPSPARGGQYVLHGSLETSKADGTVLAAISATDDDRHGSVGIYGPGDEPIAFLGATSDGEGAVVTQNGSGARLVELGVTDEGAGRLLVSDPSGKLIPGALFPEKLAGSSDNKPKAKGVCDRQHP